MCGRCALCADGRLYSATAADWSSRDSLIYSRPLRTEQHNSHWLNGNAHLFRRVSLSVSVYVRLRVSVSLSRVFRRLSLSYAVPVPYRASAPDYFPFSSESAVVSGVRPEAPVRARLPRWERLSVHWYKCLRCCCRVAYRFLLQLPAAFTAKKLQSNKQYRVAFLFSFFRNHDVCGLLRPVILLDSFLSRTSRTASDSAILS